MTIPVTRATLGSPAPERPLDNTMQTIRHHLRIALHDEAGEGVISTGIVILIMALLGAAMWATFSTVMDDAGDAAEDQIDSITTDE